jgi:hypothetical protein
MARIRALWLCALAALFAACSAAAPAASAPRAEGAGKSEGGSKGAPRRSRRAPLCACGCPPHRASALTLRCPLVAAYFTEISLPLEHALGADAAWTRAGTLNARANFDKRGAVRFSQLKVVRDAPSASDAAALNALLAAGGLYRARLPANALKPDERHVVAFLPLRCIVDAGLAEHLSVGVDEAGRIYGLELAPPGGACAPAVGAPPKPPALWVLRSTASTRLPKEAPPLASTAQLAVNASTLDAPVEDAPAAAMTPPPPERSALAKVCAAACARCLAAPLTRVRVCAVRPVRCHHRVQRDVSWRKRRARGAPRKEEGLSVIGGECAITRSLTSSAA